jgi:hypothetical protein
MLPYPRLSIVDLVARLMLYCWADGASASSHDLATDMVLVLRYEISAIIDEPCVTRPGLQAYSVQHSLAGVKRDICTSE